MKKGVKLILVMVGLAFSVLFAKTLIELISVKLKKEAITNEIQTLKKDIATAETRKLTLYNDADYVEETARGKLGLVKEGETVFVIAGGKKK